MSTESEKFLSFPRCSKAARTMAVASIHTIDLLECRSTEHCRDLELVVEQPETLPYDSHASDDDDDDVDVVALHLCYLHTE